MNARGFLVGGTVRDLLLNRQVKDFDFTIDLSPCFFLKQLTKKIKGKVICLDEEHSIYRLITKDKKGYDISPLRGNSILNDLFLRDFPINAMAIDLEDVFSTTAPSAYSSSINIIDPHGGLPDLSQGIIRALSDTVFLDDPLRILRAYRLAAQLNFSIEQRTKDLIKRDTNLLENIAAERIRDELLTILSLQPCSHYLELLFQDGCLPLLFLQMLPPGSFETKSRQDWSIVLPMMKALEDLFDELTLSTEDSMKALHLELIKINGHQNNFYTLLKLAILIYPLITQDIEKQKDSSHLLPQRTKSLLIEGHLIDLLLKNLCLTSAQQKYLLFCLHAQDLPISILNENHCTPKYFYRFFKRYTQAGLGALLICLARQRALQAPPSQILPMSNLVKQMIQFYFSWYIRENQPLFDGNFFMEKLHLPAGPVIGVLLAFLEEEKAEGKIKNMDDALNLAREFVELKLREATYPS